MKIVQVTTSSAGGAGIAALRLHNALRRQGVRSAYISKDKTIDFEDVEIEDSFFSYRKPSIIQKIKRKLKSVFTPNQDERIKQNLASIQSKLEYEIISLPFSPFCLEEHPLVVEADLINLHWVSGLIDYEQFFSKIKKPIVWTLHDMNPFLGLFHYLEDEAYNAKFIGDFDDHIKQIKSAAISNVLNATIISPSQWLLAAAAKSGVFDHFSAMKTIPNAIDFETYSYMEKLNTRTRLRIRETEFVLLFTAGNVDNKRKGGDLFVDALEFLSFSTTVLVVGTGTLKVANPKVKTKALGYVDAQEEMATYYTTADAFVLPSREDNLPNAMLESFACGTPVISFELGGMKEYITDGFNGCMARELSGKELAITIEKFFRSKSDYAKKEIRKFAEENFHPKIQAEKYRKVYLELLKNETPIN